MIANRNSDTLLVWAGGLGLLVLLVIALTYAVVDSGAYYQPEQINQIVQEQGQQ